MRSLLELFQRTRNTTKAVHWRDATSREPVNEFIDALRPAAASALLTPEQLAKKVGSSHSQKFGLTGPTE